MPSVALVTGASSGIGRALALELAAGGDGVVLVGRDAAALERVAGDCRERGAPSTRVIPQDLADSAGAAKIFERLRADGVTVDTLVNNAGAGVHGDFRETDTARELEMVRVQLDATIAMTKLFLAQPRPGRAPRRILNVGSVYSYATAPYQAVYAATKSFILTFSEALAYELRDTGTTVTVLCPGSTRTEFRKRAGAHDASGMDPERVAREGIAAMRRGRFSCVPGAQNRLFTVVMRHLPMRWRARLVQAINAKRGLKAPTGRAGPSARS